MMGSQVKRLGVLLLVLLYVLPSLAADCNGHGRINLAEATLHPLVCECYQCYTGPNCTEIIPGCALETRVAEAELLMSWFEDLPPKDSITINVDAGYHLGYLKSPRTFPPGANGSGYDEISLLLNASIRALHSKVGNVNQDGMTLVVGAGGVQLIDAALYALTQIDSNKNKQMCVYAAPPYYPHFRMTSGLNPLTHWISETNGVSNNTIIEVVTSPNNPDGRWITPAIGESGGQLTDYVYNWPHYAAAKIKPCADDVMIFSLSKLAGFAASRVGWAFVRDPQTAAIMSNYMWLQSTAPAVESQLRAVKVLNAISTYYGQDGDFFAFAKASLAHRWELLSTLFESSTRFQLASKSSGNLFIWVKCLQKSDQQDCAAPFKQVGIMTETGVGYGADTTFVRICVGHHDSTFDLLLSRLQKLVAETATSREDVMAEQRKPSSSFVSASVSKMSQQLNVHFANSWRSNIALKSCSAWNVAELLDVEKRLSMLYHVPFSKLYQRRNDPRGHAFASLHPDVEIGLAQEKSEYEDVVRDAACFRIMMQYVHHLNTTAKRLVQEQHAIPLLPESTSAYDSLLSSGDMSASAQTVRRLHDDATQCAKCHISGSSPSPPAPTPFPGTAPVVPLWPTAFDVRFGLNIANENQTVVNASSHMHYSSTLPGMKIIHSVCPRHFLPQIPDFSGSCNWTFHSNGLWITWQADTRDRSAALGCCSVISADMSANLGRNELNGFTYLGNATVSNFFGQQKNAEAWMPGPNFPEPQGFRLYVDPNTSEDVHYHNGGPYNLSWALDRRQVREQPADTFALPSLASCDRPCSSMEGGHVADTAADSFLNYLNRVMN